MSQLILQCTGAIMLIIPAIIVCRKIENRLDKTDNPIQRKKLKAINGIFHIIIIICGAILVGNALRSATACVIYQSLEQDQARLQEELAVIVEDDAVSITEEHIVADVVEYNKRVNEYNDNYANKGLYGDIINLISTTPIETIDIESRIARAPNGGYVVITTK